MQGLKLLRVDLSDDVGSGNIGDDGVSDNNIDCDDVSDNNVGDGNDVGEYTVGDDDVGDDDVGGDDVSDNYVYDVGIVANVLDDNVGGTAGGIFGGNIDSIIAVITGSSIGVGI
jgi:hypothetical protein